MDTLLQIIHGYFTSNNSWILYFKLFMDTLLQIIHGYFTSNNVVFTAREGSINNTLKVYVLQASLYEIYRFTYVALRKLFKF